MWTGSNKSTTDQIMFIRQILEKESQYKAIVLVHEANIDFRKLMVHLGEKYSVLLSFWTLSIVRCSKEYNIYKTRFVSVLR
jgi:hypothetical protein